MNNTYEKINDIIRVKQKNILKNSKIQIIPISNDMINNSYGNISISSEKYNSIIKSIRKRCKFCTKTLFTDYTYLDKKLTIDKKTKQKKYSTEDSFFSEIYNDCVVNMYEKKNESVEDIPILNKYHDIQKLNIEIYTYGINNLITILCIKENNKNNNEPINLIKIEIDCLNFKYIEKEELTEIINIISKEIF